MLREKTKAEQKAKQAKSLTKLPKKSADTLDSIIELSDDDEFLIDEKLDEELVYVVRFFYPEQSFDAPQPKVS